MATTLGTSARASLLTVIGICELPRGPVDPDDDVGGGIAERGVDRVGGGDGVSAASQQIRQPADQITVQQHVERQFPQVRRGVAPDGMGFRSEDGLGGGQPDLRGR